MAEKLRVGLVSGVRHQDDYARVFAQHPSVTLVGMADDADLPAEYHDLNRAIADRTWTWSTRQTSMRFSPATTLTRCAWRRSTRGTRPSRIRALGCRQARARR